MKTIYLLLILALIGCSKSSPSPATLGNVVYTVTNTAGAMDVTYQNETNGTNQQVVNGSATISLKMKSGSFVYVSAQSQFKQSQVSVKITFNGKTIDQSTSTGDYCVATASGTAQ